MKKLIVLAAALVAFAVPAAPALADSVSTPITEMGQARRDNNTGGTFHCVKYYNTHDNLPVPAIRASGNLYCTPGAGGQDWRTWLNAIGFSGQFYDLFTIKSALALGGGNNNQQPAITLDGQTATNRAETFQCQCPLNGSPYWWGNIGTSMTVPAGWHWISSSGSCSFLDSGRTLQCTGGAQFITH